MPKYTILLLCLATAGAEAATWRPTDELLHAIRFVESSHGLLTWGDNGRSLGDFQISEAAWFDVSAWRRARRLPTYPYETHVWNRQASRAYAADYLAILHQQLKRRLNRPPSSAEVYAAYNMGLASFAQCEYQLDKVNATTAKKCRQIGRLTSGLR